MSSNRRENQRIEFQGNIKLRVLFTKSNQLKEIDANIVNVSEGGVYIETPEDLEEGALADLKFKLATSLRKNPLGLVKWVKPGKGVGIEFFYSSQEEKEEIKRELDRILQGQVTFEETTDGEGAGGKS